jgi:hypothetical protein
MAGFLLKLDSARTEREAQGQARQAEEWRRLTGLEVLVTP